MSKFKVLFRVDSSFKIGLGHLMRCLVLASKYKKEEVLFLCQNLEGNALRKIKESGFSYEFIKDEKIKTLCAFINKRKIKNVIIDSYEITYNDEKLLKESCHIKLTVFDDIYEKHYCDVLLNHNLYAKKNKYKNLLPSFCKIKAGSKYTLIRDEFKKDYKKTKNKIFTLMLCLGGSDFDNINLKVLKALKNLDIKINVITSSSNKNIKALEKYIKKRKNYKLLIDCKTMAKQMNKADFAIISPSVIVHEVKAMNLDFLAIQTASNQKYMSKYLKENEVEVLKKDFDKKVLKKSIKRLLK